MAESAMTAVSVSSTAASSIGVTVTVAELDPEAMVIVPDRFS